MIKRIIGGLLFAVSGLLVLFLVASIFTGDFSGAAFVSGSFFAFLFGTIGKLLRDSADEDDGY